MIIQPIQQSKQNDIKAILENERRFEKRQRDNSKLSVFYAESLTKTLKDRITESLSKPNSELLSLKEELALLRESASVQVKLFSEAHDLYLNNPDNSEAKRNVLLCAAMMSDAFDKVSKCAKTESEIRKVNAEHFDVSDLHDVVNQLVRIMSEVCGEEHVRIAELFQERVGREVSFVQATTNLTPSEVVLLMDQTIPLEPNSEPVV